MAGARLYIEPIVFLARQREHGFVKCLLDCLQGLLARLFLFGSPLLLDQALDMHFEGVERSNECRIALILNDSTARAGSQNKERRVDKPLDVTRDPRDVVQSREASIDPRSRGFRPESAPPGRFR